ncbi:MAG TPA: hypothetical protein PK014_02880 [Thermoanaerobaculia bacterium]|nr:hypothetical protein [Thermoanaerobaculia bacterium]HUM29001.1 hypothetical protein [Thermoanaerobaculia bacterium]HXK67443.1 hypothetical protein [Thermoanaerobaculia bacterium]
MSSFIGGSPFAMVRDISEGYILLSAPKLKRFSIQDLQRLREELEKVTRTMRGEMPDSSDTAKLQSHQRKLMRLVSASRVVQQEMTAKHRRG